MQSKALPLLESAVPTKSRQTRRPRTCNLSTAALLLLGQMLPEHQGTPAQMVRLPTPTHTHTHTAKTQGPSRKRKCRVRKRWNKSCEMLSSVPDVSFGLMIFRKPWLPAQDLHNIKPAKIPASMGQMTSENADGCKRKGNHFFCKYTQWGSHVPPDDPHAHTHKSSTKGT